MITHEDLMRSDPKAVARFAAWCGAECKRRPEESDGAYRFRFCAAVIRRLKKMRSRKNEVKDSDPTG